jgi:hypothetical protein
LNFGEKSDGDPLLLIAGVILKPAAPIADAIWKSAAEIGGNDAERLLGVSSMKILRELGQSASRDGEGPWCRGLTLIEDGAQIPFDVDDGTEPGTRDQLDNGSVSENLMDLPDDAVGRQDSAVLGNAVVTAFVDPDRIPPPLDISAEYTGIHVAKALIDLEGQERGEALQNLLFSTLFP